MGAFGLDTMQVVVGVVVLGVILVSLIGIRAGAGSSHTLEGWVVNDRGMGPIMTWFLLGTEVYTAFTFIGLAGDGDGDCRSVAPVGGRAARQQGLNR